MSVDSLTPPRAPRPPGDAKLVQYDEYIDKQIRSTRRMVKVVDIATALVLLAIGGLAFLLTAALVEHWLVPSGFNVAERTVLFALLMGGAGYFAFRRLWPLCVRAINPVYAAHTIEQGSPTLKNSLINLLLFRQRRTEISEAVYHTLEEQAAQRLTRVPVDSAVDRTHLIRVGYVLLAMVAAAALYKVFSPKDPLVAAERVLLPWSDLVPASRVRISAVEPGATTLARGEFLNVSAEVDGIGENDPVLLRYTTADGQSVDKPIPMTATGAGLRFTGRLPDSVDASGAAGVAQNLIYRIEAGDARSLNYRVTVVAAPSILVERVEYDYPAYTGYVDRKVDGLGDLRAIEGTRVTIHARANGPIEEADVDFDADGRRDLRMTADGDHARATFELALRDDRQTPQHLSYVLRFTNGDGRPNRDPVKHPIDVVPDYAPEVAILAPPEKSLDVRLNETVLIDIEARDPDFALAKVRLEGEVAGKPAFDAPLLEAEHAGKFTKQFRFTPSEHNLRAGDIVQYWAMADDSRAPKPNSMATEKRTFRITSPDPAREPPPDRIAQRDQQQQPGDKQGQQGEQGQEQQESGQAEQGAGGNQGGQDGQEQPGQPGQQPGDKQQPQDGQQQQQPNQGGAAGGEPQQGNESGAKNDGQQQGGQTGGKDGVEDDPARSQDDSQGAQQQPGQQGAGEKNQQNSDGKQTGAGSASGDSPQNESQPDGARPDPDQGQGEKLSNQKRRNGTPPASTPVSSEGDDDGTAFERIRDHLKQKGELKEGESEPTDADQPDGESTSVDGKQKPNGESTSADGQKDLAQDDKPPSETGEKSQSPGGQETSTKGPSGGGEEPGENQGAPDSQEGMKSSPKRDQAPSQKPGSDAKEPPTPGHGKRESDSQGEAGGDRPGGGEEGGGQKANRDGTGSAGQNQSADEGAGESSEQGAGNDSPNAGQDAAADHNTGQPGAEKPGEGSTRKEGQGDQPGGKAGEEKGEHGENVSQEDAQTDGESTSVDGKQQTDGESTSADGSKNSDPSSSTSPRGGPATGNGGDTDAGLARPSSSEGAAPNGDAANLDYARKQTDLVLDKLADQLSRKQVDEKLLKELGWSEEEMRTFVERWQRRKEAARRADPTAEGARRELDEALRSLGLRRGPLRQSQAPEDNQRDLRQGYRGPVPPEYQERLRAYNQGVSRARQDEE